jgi:hypothetical protein
MQFNSFASVAIVLLWFQQFCFRLNRCVGCAACWQVRWLEEGEYAVYASINSQPVRQTPFHTTVVDKDALHEVGHSLRLWVICCSFGSFIAPLGHLLLLWVIHCSFGSFITGARPIIGNGEEEKTLM